MNMKMRLFFSALFSIRNLGVLAISLFVAWLAGKLPFISASPFTAAALYYAAVAVYAVSVVQSLTSRKFGESFEHKLKIENIKELNYKAKRLFIDTKKVTDYNYYLKMRKILEDKNIIYESFFRSGYDPLKEKILTQALSLAVAYINMLYNYSVRRKELSDEDMGEVLERLKTNRHKASYVKDPLELSDIQKVIDIDEKTIARIGEEKKDLESIAAKLDYIESSVGMFKHRMLSNIDSEDLLEKTSQIVDEASALNNALTEHRKHKLNAGL